MKVLLLNECHYRRGGADIVYLNTGKLLEAHGHEVHYFSVKSAKNLSCADDVYFFRKNRKGLCGVLNFFYDRRAASALENLIQDVKPDIADVHLLWGALTPSVLRVLWKHRIPVVHTVHDYLMLCPVNHFLDNEGHICEKCKQFGYKECIKKRCYKGQLIKSALLAAEIHHRNKRYSPSYYLNGIVFVSSFSRNKHFEHNKSLVSLPSIVLYNCSPDKGRPTPSNQGYYLYFGRLSEEKGVDTLIKAFKQTPQFILKIVGNGPLRNKLEMLAEGADNIQFLGYKTGDELSALINGCRFVVIPSRCYENNPMTIVESYGMGRPVIGSRIGGIPEIIEEGITGFTFEMNNSMDLVRVLRQSSDISETEYEKMTQASFLFHKKHFSQENYYSQLIGFFNTLIQHKG